jgi:hypothetical protein
LLFISSVARSAPAVLLSDVRVAVEPSDDDSLFVKEFITLKPMGPSDAPNPDGIVIPLPGNATNAVLGEDVPSDGITIEKMGLLIKGSIPQAGRSVAVTFNTPIADGRAVIEQSFGAPIALAFAAYVGELDGMTFSGRKFSQSEKDSTPDGMPALFISGKNLTDGRIIITVDGFGKGPIRTVTVIATIFCFLVLGIGFVLWIRRRGGKDPDFQE